MERRKKLVVDWSKVFQYFQKVNIELTCGEMFQLEPYSVKRSSGKQVIEAKNAHFKAIPRRKSDVLYELLNKYHGEKLELRIFDFAGEICRINSVGKINKLSFQYSQEGVVNKSVYFSSKVVQFSLCSSINIERILKASGFASLSSLAAFYDLQLMGASDEELVVCGADKDIALFRSYCSARNENLY